MLGETPNYLRKAIAIRRGYDLARTLQEKHPEIADLYRCGMFCSEIVIAFDIADRYNVTTSIAIGAVGVAIRGHRVGYRTDALEGLITDQEELSDLETNHHRVAGQLVGYKSVEAHTGVHSLTKDQQIELGERSVLQNKGIHSISDAERKRNGQRSAMKRGQVPWIEREPIYNTIDGVLRQVATRLSEEEYLIMLYNSKSYINKTGKNKGKEDILKIREIINETYHHGQTIRSRKAISKKIYKSLRRCVSGNVAA